MLKAQSDRVVRKYPAAYRCGLALMSLGTILTATVLVSSLFIGMPVALAGMMLVSLTATVTGACAALWGRCHRTSFYKYQSRGRSRCEVLSPGPEVVGVGMKGYEHPALSQVRS